VNPNPNPNPNPELELDDERLAAAIRGTLQRKGDAVVAGADGLDRIRAVIERGHHGRRSARVGSGRPRLWLLTAAASVVLAVGVVGSLTRPRSTGVETVGRGSQSQDATASANGSANGSATSSVTAGLPVYYPAKIGQTYLLFREFHPWPAADAGSPDTLPATDAGPATDAVERVQAAITQAMSQRPNDPDYLVLWASHADATVAMVGEQLVITLNQAAAGGSSIAGPGADAIDIQQLIWTATAAAASGGAAAPSTVLVRADGPTPDRFGSISLAQPFRRGGPPGSGDPRAPMWIDSLGQNATVPVGPLTVTGQGTGGSTGLRWRLSLAGTVVASGPLRPTTAGGGSLGVGVRGVWSLTVNLAAAGRYHLEVAPDAPDGAHAGSDSKDFVAG
jgi:hypothetical protein